MKLLGLPPRRWEPAEYDIHNFWTFPTNLNPLTVNVAVQWWYFVEGLLSERPLRNHECDSHGGRITGSTDLGLICRHNKLYK